jgi:hypothetical protein
MLYHLLSALHDAVLAPERDALHHVPHGGGEPDRAPHRVVRRAVMIRKLREFQIGQ